MKIVFIIASLEGFGGTNRVATLLANQLSPYHEVTILSRYCLANTYELDAAVTDVKFNGSNLHFLHQCRNYTRTNTPDIVIIHTMSKLTPALLLSGIKAKRIWSLEHISYKFHALLYQQLRKRLYKKVDRIITLTKSDRENYKQFHENVTVIANATPLQIKQPSFVNPSKTIVSIGRLTYQKGYDLLIKAWSQVEQNHPDWSLQIYGEGEDREKLIQMIKDYKLNNISLNGVTDDVKSIYDSAAFYVMSSRFEGFGMVLIEAQSRGLPIISFDCPSGPAEIVTNEIDGYLVESEDIKALAERMVYLIDNKFVREKLSSNALLSAKRFKPKVIINQWVDLINKERDYSGKS